MAGLSSPPESAAGPLTPTDVILKGEERFRALTDYQRSADIVTRLGSDVQAGSGLFWFKQPRMLHVRILEGPGKGSEVAVDSSGQIRGRKRGLLSFVVKKLKASDRRLSTIRGTSMMELDWGSFFLRYHAAALRPDAAVTGPAPGPGFALSGADHLSRPGQVDARALFAGPSGVAHLWREMDEAGGPALLCPAAHQTARTTSAVLPHEGRDPPLDATPSRWRTTCNTR
jgi:hypothetical protein